MNERELVLDYFFSAQIAALQCAIDIKQSEKRKLVYNLDYSSFFYGIWRGVDPKTLYDSLSGDFYDELLGSDTIPFTPTITSVSFFEIMENFIKRIERTKDNFKYIDDKVKQINNTIKDILDSPTSGNIYLNNPLKQSFIENELGKLQDISGVKIYAAIERSKILLGSSGAVSAMGELVDQSNFDFRKMQREAKDLFEEMWSFRIGSDNNSSVDQKRFRYLVDVWNILITNYCEKEFQKVNFDYVSKAKYTSKFCPKNGRTPLVPSILASNT